MSRTTSFFAGIMLLAWSLPVRAEICCDQPVHRAGTVHNGLPLVHRFAFVNRGGPAEIIDVRSTCGCLSPQVEKRSYGPGEQGSLLLEVNTLSLAPGPQSWRTRLLYREGETTKEVEFVLVGDVVTEILVQPSALVLPADAPGVHEITVTDSRAKPLTVRAADAGSPCLRAIVGEIRQMNGTTEQRVRLAVPSDCPAGRYDLVLHLYTDDPQYGEFKVPVTVFKRPQGSVTAVPRQVTFELEKGQALAARRVLLTADSAVEVDRIEADDPALVCGWKPGPGNAATMTIQVDPARLSGDLKATIRVHVRKPAAETVAISVLCVVRQGE